VSTVSDSPSSGVLTAVRSLARRDEFFAGLYIIGCVNGLLGRFLLSVHTDGLIGAITSIDINVIVLFAAVAGVSAFFSVDKEDEIRPADLAVAAVFLGLVSLPISPLSWVAVTGLSLYILLFAS